MRIIWTISDHILPNVPLRKYVHFDTIMADGILCQNEIEDGGEKTMRKILATLLVLAMVLALVPTVMAEGEA